MAVLFPSGIKPFIFSDTLADSSADTSQANLEQHIGALNVADFAGAVPAGADTLFVTYVVFAYPNAANSATSSPKPPIVEMLKQGAGFDGPGFGLHLTPDGTDALDLGVGRFVNYTYQSLGGGAFQIVFTRDNVPLDSLDWKIRFTINDGSTSAQAQKGLTFVVGSANEQQPWIAVPGQLTLLPSGPQEIYFADARAGITIAGPSVHFGETLIGGSTYQVNLPLGNYGTSPLILTAIPRTSGSGRLSAQLQATQIVILPGCANAAAVQASYAAPAAGSGQWFDEATFVIASNDPLASPGGSSAHLNTISLLASCEPEGTVSVPDVSDMDRSHAEHAIRAAGFIARTLGRFDPAGSGLCRAQDSGFVKAGSRVRIWLFGPTFQNGQVLGDDGGVTGFLPGDF